MANETVAEWGKREVRALALQAAVATLAQPVTPVPEREAVTDLADYYLGWIVGDAVKKPHPMAMDCDTNSPEGFGCVFFSGHDGPHETMAGQRWKDRAAAEPEPDHISPQKFEILAEVFAAAGWPIELVRWVRDPKGDCPRVDVLNRIAIGQAERRLEIIRETLKILGAARGQQLTERATEVMRERDDALARAPKNPKR